MTLRTLPTIGLALVLATVLLISCGSKPGGGTESAGPAQTESSAQPRWLFTISGDLEVERAGQTQYLTLRSPTEVLAFTERPDRAQAILPVAALAAGWPIFGFDQLPPNASVTVTGQTPTAVTVTAPAITEDGALRLQVLDDTPPTGGPAAVTIDAAVVNAQITDSVTQTNVKVVGETPAMALATTYQTISSTLTEAATQQGAVTMSQDDTAQVNSAIAQIQGQGQPGGTTPTTRSAGG